MIFGLIGGPDISKYTIADILWKRISEISKIGYEFKVIPIHNFTELCTFYWSFSENAKFVGFNVALPWKSEIIKLVDFIESESKIYDSINTVYKKDNNVIASNTDIVGVEQSLLLNTDLKNKSILVIGSGGAGLPTALFLNLKYKSEVFIYDIKDFNLNSTKIIKLKNISEVEKKKYDIIINATPIGRFFTNEKPIQFSSPISFGTFQKIIHEKSIIQEMNYFPHNTEIIKFGIFNKLKIISGIEMLVYQAVTSFKLYTGFSFQDKEIIELMNFMKKYVISKEHELFR